MPIDPAALPTLRTARARMLAEQCAIFEECDLWLQQLRLLLYQSSSDDYLNNETLEGVIEIDQFLGEKKSELFALMKRHLTDEVKVSCDASDEVVFAQEARTVLSLDHLDAIVASLALSLRVSMIGNKNHRTRS